MVSPQATQPDSSSHSTDWTPRSESDSVRITAKDVPAQVRRQILREFFESEERRQETIAASESNDLKVKRSSGQPYAVAEVRASNASAVLQYIGSNVRVFGGHRDNRDFREVTR